MFKKEFSEKFRKLVEYKEKALVIEKEIDYIGPFELKEMFYKIVSLAEDIVEISDRKYSLVLSRIERAKHCLSQEVLYACMVYVQALITASKNYLELQLADAVLVKGKVDYSEETEVA